MPYKIKLSKVARITCRVALVLLMQTPVLTAAPDLTASPNWQQKLNTRIVGGIHLSGDELFLGGDDGVVRSFDKQTGTVKWRRKLDSPVRSAIATDDKRVYLMSAEGTVHALDRSDGRPLWRFSSDGESQWDYWDYYLSTPTVDDRQLYFGSGDHHIYALNKRTGQLRWRFQTGGIIHGQPVVSGEKVIAGGFEGRLFALDRASGNPLWSFKTVGTAYFRNGEIPGSAIAHEGLVYFGSRDYNLYALLEDTGTGAWNMRTPSWIVGRPLVAGEKVVVANSDGAGVYAYHRITGAESWKSKTSYNMFSSPVALGDTHLAVAGLDGRITLLSLATGEIALSLDTEAGKRNRHRYFDAEGRVNYEGVQSIEDLMTLYDRHLEELGGITGALAVFEHTIYYAAANGEVASVTIDGL